MSKRTQPDSISLYPHPFSRAYWREAAMECTRMRSLAVAALLCALAIVIEKFNIPLGSKDLQLSMSFLVISLCSMLTGPVLAIPCGLVVDLIGIIGSPYAPHFGYTLTAVLTALVYALFLYRVRPSFLRVLLAKGLVNVFINTLMGSIWRIWPTNWYGLPYGYWVAYSGIKNLCFLPLEVFLICMLFRALHSPLRQMGFLTPETQTDYRKQYFVILAVLALVSAVLIVPFAIWFDQISAFIKSLF